MRKCTIDGCDNKYYARGLCMKHYHRERRADPEWRAKENAYQRERYRSDPALRERTNARRRDRYRKRSGDPEWRAKKNARQREWQRERSGDPEWRAKENARRRTPEYRAKENAYLRERRATDPEYRAKENARRRERRARVGSGYRKHLPQLIAHQRNLCAICKKQLPKNPSKVHVDHIVHVSNGGSNESVNLRAVHARCNIARKNRWTSGQPQLPLG